MGIKSDNKEEILKQRSKLMEQIDTNDKHFVTETIRLLKSGEVKDIVALVKYY